MMQCETAEVFVMLGLVKQQHPEGGLSKHTHTHRLHSFIKGS